MLITDKIWVKGLLVFFVFNFSVSLKLFPKFKKIMKKSTDKKFLAQRPLVEVRS
jgi:hypothetical protein